jgi:hypothetical protein
VKKKIGECEENRRYMLEMWGRGKGREERGGNKRMGESIVLIVGGQRGEEL